MCSRQGEGQNAAKSALSVDGGFILQRARLRMDEPAELWRDMTTIREINLFWKSPRASAALRFANCL